MKDLSPNVKEMWGHAVAYGLYLLSALMIDFIDRVRSIASNNVFLAFSMVWITLFLVSQLWITFILHQIYCKVLQVQYSIKLIPANKLFKLKPTEVDYSLEV